MYMLKITLILVMIQLLSIFHSQGAQNTDNEQDPPTADSESKSEHPKQYILPLVEINYLNHFMPPTTIAYSPWKEGDKFLTAETIFSGSVPAGKQVFLCGDNSNDEYCSFPVNFEKLDILQCSREPKPFIKKLLIKDSVKFIDIPCGENKRGRLYGFIYKGGPIEILGEYESYRFCLDIAKKELLYTRHKLPSLDLFTDKRLKQERQISYKLITDAYNYFGSWFEEMQRRYYLLEKWGYKPMKLVPSDHFPLALWKKTTYHCLNTMPMHQNLIKLWEYIDYRIRQDGIQNQRQYEFYTRAFPIENLENPAEEIQSPDIWITIVKCVQRRHKEDIELAVAIILNNKFEKTPNSVTEFITENYCKKNLCQKTFPEPLANISQSVHCCAVNDAIKVLFEERFYADRVLKPDFLFDPENNTPVLTTIKSFVTSPSKIVRRLSSIKETRK